jgi:predicted nuclease of restriction endonuclease-like (RecB) superfamily
MGKKKDLLMLQDTNSSVDEIALFNHVSEIIENRRSRAGAYVNHEVTMMFWEIGQHIGSAVLDGSRGQYGKRIVVTLAQQLQEKYGNSFDYANVSRMVKFAKRFPDNKIVVPLAQQLSWSHIIALLPLKNDEAFMYYAQDAIARGLGKRELRQQISRKAYERREIANTRIDNESPVPFNVFKDPYLLDVLDLKENFLEADLEKAILTELEKFILEFGQGFTFVERQKRMTLDGEEFWLDLLFYHRDLERLVAIELKLDSFKAAHVGQMTLYLKWLSKFERRENENEPIGLILCSKASRSKIELMELDKSGIAVAEYWTKLPPKAFLEEKVSSILREAQERLERRKTLPDKTIQKQLDYFYEEKDDD